MMCKWKDKEGGLKTSLSGHGIKFCSPPTVLEDGSLQDDDIIFNTRYNVYNKNRVYQLWFYFSTLLLITTLTQISKMYAKPNWIISKPSLGGPYTIRSGNGTCLIYSSTRKVLIN